MGSGFVCDVVNVSGSNVTLGAGIWQLHHHWRAERGVIQGQAGLCLARSGADRSSWAALRIGDARLKPLEQVPAHAKRAAKGVALASR